MSLLHHFMSIRILVVITLIANRSMIFIRDSVYVFTCNQKCNEIVDLNILIYTYGVSIGLEGQNLSLKYNRIFFLVDLV